MTYDWTQVAMGLSLGEYSALCYAGALSFEDGVRVTKVLLEAKGGSSAVSSVASSLVKEDVDAVLQQQQHCMCN